MMDVFESMESDLNAIWKQNEILKNQLLEATLKHDVEKCVLMYWTQTQSQKDINELIESVNQKTYAYGDVRAHNQDLLITISELKAKLKTIEQGQFSDGDLEVAFRSKTCYVQDLEGDDLLTGSYDSNLYTISISDMEAFYPISDVQNHFTKIMVMAPLKTHAPELWERERKLLFHLNWFPILIFLDTNGQIKVLPPETAKEILARERERKARTTLLMALPEDHLAKFHKMTDAKEMWDAIKSRFGGNDESKKMQKYILKQQFEGFSVSNSEGLHKGYDRFQSLLSQLEIHGAGVSTEDANQKFLRSLPSSWSQVSLVMRTKPGVDSLSFDDLYNNLRVFESDVKGSTGSSSSAQNVAFVSSESTSSTNDVSTAYGVSTSSGYNSQRENSSSYTDELMYSFFANQSSGPHLDHEDLEQLDEFDLEEMDLKWQVAMISMRLKKFYKKTGRRLQFDAKEPVGFDKTKVECYNCHNTRHFARECRSKGNQDSRRRDAGNTGYRAKDNRRRPGKQEEPKALVTLDGEGVDWTSHAEDKQENFALMAYSNSGSDTEVEAQLVAHQKNQLWYKEKIRFMKIDLDDKTDVLTYHKKLLAEAVKEKEDLKTKLENFQSSSKGLGKLLNSQMSTRDKSGLGSSDVEDSPVHDRFAKVEGMHAVPPPMTWIYMPPKFDFGIDVSNFTYGPKQSKTSESAANTIVSKPKVWSDAPIIEEYESDSDDEYVIKPSKEQEKPSLIFPKADKRDWNGLMSKKLGLGYGFTKKACFVCGSFSHLIRDCDFHEKRMAKQVELNKQKGKGTGQGENRPVWNNVQRLNHQNKFVPKAVLTKTGIFPVNAARQNPSSQAAETSTARKVNTARPIVNEIRQRNNFYKSHSPIRRPFNKSTAPKANFTNHKVNTAGDKTVSAVRGYRETVVKTSDDPQKALERKKDLHMTGNKAYLAEYQDFNGGPVAFRGSKGYITGKGKIKTGKLDFEDVCFVKELQQFNLFSVSQICDKKNKVLFTNSKCLVLSPEFKLPDENQVLLRIPRQNNMYSFNLENIVPSGGKPCKRFTNTRPPVRANQFSWVFFLRTKDETSGILKDFIRQIENQLNQKVKTIRCDNGTEFKNRDVIEFCGSKGIKRKYSNARTPQQNGVAERKNMTLIEAARTMLADSFLPNTFWAEAVSTACYVLNRVLVTKPQNKTPYELVTGPKEANHSAGTQDNIDAGNSEMEAEPAQEYFILPLWSSYTSTVKSSEAKNRGEKPNGDTGSKTNEEPKDQPFLEELERLKRQEKEANDAAEAFRKEFAQCTEGLFLQTGAARATNTNTVNNVSTPISTASPSRVFSAGGLDLPNNDQDDSQIPALKEIYDNPSDEIFTNASYDEGVVADFTNLETTVNVSPIPTSRIHSIHLITQILGDPTSAVQTWSKEELLNKKDEKGVVVRNKARLVAQGYRQEDGIDYDVVFAPIARIEAIRIFLAFASYIGFIVYPMDVKSAFLYGTIDEEVYVSQPPGFVDPKFPKKVYKVVKALYGLHQAPKAWYATLSIFLLKNRYRRGTIDKTLFIKKDRSDIMLVQQKEDGIFISQDKYVAEILKKFDFANVKSASTPFETQKPLNKDEEAADMDVHLYRSMIGSLMYLTAFRPDIMFAVCACSRVSSFDLEAYSDSDYAGANLDWKSTTGEAEYVAAANCYGQVLWIQNQMLDYGFNFMNTKIYIDNESTICIVKNLVFHSKTKHIEIRHHFIRNTYEKKLIQLHSFRGGKMAGSAQPTETPQPTPSPTQPSTGDQPPGTESSYRPDTTQVLRDYLEGTDGSKGDQLSRGECIRKPTAHAEVITPSMIRACKCGEGGDKNTQNSRKTLEGSGRNDGDQVQLPYDSPLSGGHTSERAEEILKLKTRIKKLEKKCKPNISYHRAWLRSVSILSMKKKLGKKESISKQGRKNAKLGPTLDGSAFNNLNADGMDYIDTEEAVNEGRHNKETEELNVTHDTEVLEKGGSNEEQVNAAGNIGVSTAMPEVSTVNISTARRLEVSTATPMTPLTTTSVFYNEDITLAETLVKMKDGKAKLKGVAIKEVKESDRPARSVLTLKPLPKIDPKDKGKGVLEEEHVPAKKLKKSDLDAAQLAMDKEYAKQVNAELQVELERERVAAEEATQAVLASEFDEIQAKMNADTLLAERHQEAEREQFTVIKRAKFFA
ncbi:putative ribonuclease H-like domain-containing protein [Tanacetum coccineum]